MGEASGEAPRHSYRIFGLSVTSELPLPEATPLHPAPADFDVAVELGATPSMLPGRARLAPWLEVQGRNCLLLFAGLGRFFVEEGRRILVEKDEQASFDDLRGFLFGSAFGALLHQRGLVPLHVSAVLSPSGVIAFTGDSGAGKSTTAALLNQELGWPLICDDVAVLREQSDGLHLQSGLMTIKLWEDALRALGQSSEGLRRDLTRYDKFHAIQSDRFFNGSAPLKRLVQLGWANDVECEGVRGRRAFQVALDTIYRPEMVVPLSDISKASAVCVTLASSVPIHRLVRPQDHSRRRAILDELARL
jgi:hypothetical protein